jgi:hypothetical protein
MLPQIRIDDVEGASLKVGVGCIAKLRVWAELGLKYTICLMLPTHYTPLAVVSRARKTLRVSTTAGIAQIPDVSSKDGAVIGAVLSTRKFHRGHH